MTIIRGRFAKPKENKTFFKFCDKCGEKFKPNGKRARLCSICYKEAMKTKGNWKVWKRKKLLSIHYGYKCNRKPRCSFCYCLNKAQKQPKNDEFWYAMAKYIPLVSEGLSIGSYGEPLVYTDFWINFCEKLRAKDKSIKISLTTNGNLLRKIDKNKAIKLLGLLDMISVSFNKELIRNLKDISEFQKNIDFIRRYSPDCSISVNLLMNEDLLKVNKSKGKLGLIDITEFLLKRGVDNIYCLYPKNTNKKLDILKYKWVYYYLSKKYDNFFTDDATKMILSEGRYKNWTKCCHYGVDMVSINPSGEVVGCSFDEKPLLLLNEPKDLLKVRSLNIKKRHNCPFLEKKK